MNQLNKAIIMAATKHDGQVYSKDMPYIVHPIGVMESVLLEYPGDIALAVVAVLHDVIEDTPTTFMDIEAEFGVRIAMAVNILSRKDGQDYDSYIREMSLGDSHEHVMARIVKRHDLLLNLSNIETSSFSKEKKDRLSERYAKALRSLPSKAFDREKRNLNETKSR